MNVQTVVQLSGQVAALNQRVTVLQNQIMSSRTSSNVSEALQRQICKLEQDLKATTAVVMMLRNKVDKFTKFSQLDIEIANVKALIDLISQILKDPANSIYATASPVIKDETKDPPYIVNNNASTRWNINDPENPTFGVQDKNKDAQITMDPNNKIVTIGNDDNKIILNGSDGSVQVDDRFIIDNSGIKTIMTDPLDDSKKELIMVVKSTDTWPSTSFDKNTDSLYKFLASTTGNDTMIDLLVNGEKYYDPSSHEILSIIPERFGTKSLLGLLLSNNSDGQISSMPPIEFRITNGKIVGGWKIAVDNGELVHRSDGRTNYTGSPYQWTGENVTNISDYLFANIYNLRTNIEIDPNI